MTEILPQRPYVGAHLLLIQDEKLLLMKRIVKDELAGRYALVAGKVDQFENPRKALAREVFEEVGIHILPENLEHLATVHHAETNYLGQKHDVIEFYFLPKTWEGVPMIMEPDKASELAFFALDDLPTPLPKGLLHALAALKGGSRFIEN